MFACLALSAYQKAYKTDDTLFWKSPSALFGLGLVYFHFRAYPFAAETFNYLLYSYPDLECVVEVYSRLGFIYKNLEVYDLSFNAALNCSYDSWFLPKIELHFQIAHCYDCAGDLEKAFTEYRTLLSDPNTQLKGLVVELFEIICKHDYSLGWICYRTDCPRQNRPQKILDAEGYLIQSRDLEPSCGKTYYYLGRCYGELPERARDAFVNYRESIDKSEADADTWCSIGVLYQQQNQPMDALQVNLMKYSYYSYTSDIPGSFSLLSTVHLPITASAEEILDECEKRIKNPSEFKEIFEERVPPPKPPNLPTEHLTDEQVNRFFGFCCCNESELLRRKTYVVIIEQKKDAFSMELQNFCKNKPIILIRGLTAALRMDLAIFSTKSFLEFPDHPVCVELRTQYRMSSPDINVDHLGKPTWSCYSAPSKTDIRDYAQYQAQHFQHCLKEEAEKLRSAGAKYGGTTQSDSNNTLKFGVNVDLSDENKFHKQFNELSKLPPFCRPAAGCNMLTHLGHSVVGMSNVQLYLKVPGSRTPGHQEDNCLASVNINIGPGDCEWFAVSYEYWGLMRKMLKKRDLDFLKGSWWPNYEDLINAGIPVHRFIQRAGDVVYVGSGCIHWVQSLGWCNNISWSVGRRKHYTNFLLNMHLSWQLARNIRFSDQKLYTLIKNMLIRSLAYSKMVYDMVVAAGKTVQMHSRHKGDSSPYCSVCEVEVWNLVFAKPENGKYIVYCVQCARNADLNNFRVLQQYTFEELSATYDNFRLYPVRNLFIKIKNIFYYHLFQLDHIFLANFIE
uniref:JmjC domain-containing protein n=1 Tax=Syphacia muris TaxID=451379 RepID=A0A0N5AKW0_9BILA